MIVELLYAVIVEEELASCLGVVSRPVGSVQFVQLPVFQDAVFLVVGTFTLLMILAWPIRVVIA